MELNKTKNWFYILTSLSMAFVLVLGGWWLFLVFKLANKLQASDIPGIEGNLITMVQWEGLTFFVLLFAIGSALFYVFFQDHKKTKSIQTFFASLTHELKTPLASIRLQSQVLNEFLNDLSINDEDKNKLQKYTKRLKDDSIRLENELDRHLQLSRLERGGVLNFQSINLIAYLKNEFLKYPDLTFSITGGTKEQLSVSVDEFAFSMIIRNLIENTIKHSSSNSIDIVLKVDSTTISLIYADHGDKFCGNLNQLGNLFYKYSSPKGSGIGLYIIKSLIRKMGGELYITNIKSLIFRLTFKRSIQ